MSEALEMQGELDDTIETLATIDMLDDADVCGLCQSPLVRKRYVQTHAAEFYVLCSKECSRVVAHRLFRERWAARQRGVKRLAIGLIFAGAYLAPHAGPYGARRAARAASMARSPREVAAAANASPAPVLPPG